MAPTNCRTTPAATTPNASASIGSDAAGRARDGTGTQRRAGGTLSSFRQRLIEWLSSLEGPRKLAINGLMILVTVLGYVVVGKAAWKQVVVIDTIGVPAELEAHGYTPATVRQRIIDAVAGINRDAAAAKRIGIYTLREADPLHPDSADFDGLDGAQASSSSFILTSDDPLKKYDVSVGGVSFTTVVVHLRELFGVSDTRISGEIAVENSPAAGIGGNGEKPAAKKFAIRLRITDKTHIHYETAPTDKLETLFEEAALKLVERFEPLNAGYYRYYQGDYENALRIVRAYLADPTTTKDKEWALNLGGLIAHARHRHDGERAEKGFNKAIDAFRELEKRYPQFTPGLYNLGFILADLGRKRMKRGDQDGANAFFSEAHEVARKGISIDEAPGNAGRERDRERAAGYATAARALRHLGRYGEALDELKRSIKADPKFIYAYLSQGRIHQLRGALDEAIASYQLAVEIDPSAQTFRRAGSFLRRDKRHLDSVAMFQRAAELAPSANAYASWGMAVRDSGRHDEARELFERAIEIDPNSPNGYNQLGLTYLAEERWDEAADKFAKASKLSPRWSNYQYNLGLALSGAGKLGEAIAAFKKAIAINPSHASSYEELGVTLAKRDCQEKGGVTENTSRSVEENLRKAKALKAADPLVGEIARRAKELLNCPHPGVELNRSASSAGEKAHGGLEADERPGRRIGSF
jgi:tetratricopeptide (TPR) repeat protein